MATLARGSIIWAMVPDPQGRNPKPRPLVVLTPPDQIPNAAVLQCVAVTTQTGQAPADAQVPLPWQPRGHPRTGLKSASAAVYTWLVQVAKADVQSIAGSVPARQLLDILNKVAELAAAQDSATNGEDTVPADPA